MDKVEQYESGLLRWMNLNMVTDTCKEVRNMITQINGGVVILSTMKRYQLRKEQIQKNSEV